MPQNRKSTRKTRCHAFAAQNGRCYYCRQPMWKTEPHIFMSQYGISEKQVRFFQCTGEHLIAYQDGEVVSRENIVAACFYCNSPPHSPRKPRSPSDYQQRLSERMKQGRWHVARLRANC